MNKEISNRIHHHVVVENYDKSIFKISFRMILLQTLKNCIEEYMFLYEKTSLIQSDISLNNIMINERDSDDICHSFLIDLDLVIHRD